MNSDLLRRQLAVKKGVLRGGGFAPPGSVPPRAGAGRRKKLAPLHKEIAKAVQRAEKKSEEKDILRAAPPPQRQLAPIQGETVKKQSCQVYRPSVERREVLSPTSKRFDRVSVAGGGVAANPDASFFAQQRELKKKKILFQHSGINPLEWEAKKGDEKWAPKAKTKVDYTDCVRALRKEHIQNRAQAKQQMRGTFSFGFDDMPQAPSYWTSGQDLFAGKLDLNDLRNQRIHNAKTRKQLTQATFDFGFDPEYR